MSDINILPVTSKEQATQQALEVIQAERTGKQLGLLTRFPAFNIAMRKYLRFNTVNLWAGLSGHGKSYLLNLITEDCLDYLEQNGLNYNIDFIPVVLQFCFEMSSHTEILRSCANDLGFNYNHLLSSHYDKNTKTYNRLTDEELVVVEAYMKYYRRKSILFFETAGNINLIYNTVAHYVRGYNAKNEAWNRANPDKPPRIFKFIINLDHTLLVERLGEKDALELMANIGKIAIRIRKEFGAMVNLVGQLNNNIENTDRILKPALHSPIKSDIYAQGQLYNACDSVFTIHQPSLLGIKQYGINKKDTRGLMHLQVLKARHGSIGNIWLLNLLSEGKIIPYPKPIAMEEDENISNSE